MALIVAALLGMTLLSYLNLTGAQIASTTGSRDSNSAIPVAEKGVEEALAQLYYSSTNLAANGWASNANNVFTLSRTMSEGRFIAIISNASPPVILSTGFSKSPRPGVEVQQTIRVNTRFGKDGGCSVASWDEI